MKPMEFVEYFYKKKKPSHPVANCEIDRTVLRSKTDAERSERTFFEA